MSLTVLRPVIPDKTARILILGCGNSTLSEDVGVSAPMRMSLSKHSLNHPRTIPQMNDDEYKNIVNLDVRSCR
jgi:hypothetical protein